ncbi:ORFL309C [Human betaherpesvirus 5]|nr:ORFL309C [Human betaherpesvirus 5]
MIVTTNGFVYQLYSNEHAVDISFICTCRIGE